MRTFLRWTGYASLIMAGVSADLGLLGRIEPVAAGVFVLTFVGLWVLIRWELEYTPE